jgi:hypothetical protein
MVNSRKTPTVTRMTPYGGNYFFGYYDLTPQNMGGDKYLYHRVDFIDRIQKRGDRALLGWFDPGVPTNDPSCFNPVVETSAWNFQQGAMLQWHPAQPDSTIIYNHEDKTAYKGVVHNLITGEKHLLDQPVANVSPCGEKAVSINFSRMYTFRPGYGYAGIDDPWFSVNQPADDGIYRINLSTGEAPLILSLKSIWERTLADSCPTEKQPKILVNHITWNTTGSRFLFLLRYISSKGGGWKTSVMVSDDKGDDLQVLIPFGFASHYWWTGEDEVMFYSQGKEAGSEPGLYLINVKDKTFIPVNRNVFNQDVHCSVFPGSDWILNDTYPHPYSSLLNRGAIKGNLPGYRRLFLYNNHDKSVVQMGNFFSPPQYEGDIRCDLHPRWSRDNSYFTFDSLHEGFRGIYRVDWKENYK